MKNEELEQIIRTATAKLTYACKQDYVETWSSRKNGFFLYSSNKYAKPGSERVWFKGKIAKNSTHNYIVIDTFLSDKNEEIFNAIQEIMNKTKTTKITVTDSGIKKEYKQKLEEMTYATT